jgi:hypothetical protein
MFSAEMESCKIDPWANDEKFDMVEDNGSGEWINAAADVAAAAAGTRTETGLPDFSWYNIPNRGKMYQMTTKYTK